MKRSFKKAIACLLAVLMIVSAFPFTAFASTTVVGWWGDNNWNGATNPNVPYGEQTYTTLYEHLELDPDAGDINWGESYNLVDDELMTSEDILANLLPGYKPNLTITVSSQGNSAKGDFAAESRVKNQFFGYNDTYTYEKVKADGNILNPAQLKQGQRIAVTFELGGFDLFYCAQIKGMYDTTALAPYYYKVNAWTAVTDSNQDKAWIAVGGTKFNQASVFSDVGSYNLNATDGQIYYPMSGSGAGTTSVFCPANQRQFGNNGLYCCTLSFEVLKDCDLSEVLDLTDNVDHSAPIGSTYAQAVAPSCIGGLHGKFSLDSESEEPYTFALLGLTYTDYEKSSTPSTPSTDTYTFVPIDDREVEDLEVAAGETPAAEDLPANKATEIAHVDASVPSKHTTTTYSWSLNAETKTYTEVADSTTADCSNWTSSVKTSATCGTAGVTTFTCPTCGYSYDDNTTPHATGEHAWDYDNAASPVWDGFDSCTVTVPCANCDATTTATSTSVESAVTTTATCEVEGVKTYTAHFDNGIADVTTTENLGYGDHVQGAWAHVDGTTNENSKHARVCTVCGENREEVACDFSYAVITPATETTTGTGRYTCQTAGCGYSYDVTIPVKDCAHNDLEPHAAQAATCVTAGNTAYWYCPTCEKYFSDADCNVETTLAATVLAATGVHDYDYANVSAPVWTGYTACSVTATCKNCPATTEVQATAITDEVTTTATCEVEGVKTYTATFPNGIANATTTENLGYGAHTPEKTEAQAPSCTEDGNIAYWTCTTCDKIFSDEACTTEISAADTVDPATGHTGVATAAKAATCVATGNVAYWTCSDCGKTFSDADCTAEITDVTTAIDPANHNGAPTELDPTTAIPAQLDSAGKEADTICSACKATLAEGAVIPALKGYTVNVTAVELGATTLDGEDAKNGIVDKKVLANSDIVLEALPVEGAEFVGWEVNGKIVSTSATYTMTVVADVTIVPVFATTAADEFTVIFVDSYGNVIKTQTVGRGTDIVEPVAPTRTGYTFAGWSKTEAEIDALTEGATITAKYTKNPEALFTVTATGCTITVNGADYDDVATDVAYDTKVTVTKAGTDVWTINGAEVAYGESYSFYVGSNVEVVAVDNDAAIPMATVANVAKTKIQGTVKYSYLATSSVPTGYTVVSRGFIYGKGVDTAESAMVLENVGSGYAAMYNKTTAAQFALAVGTASTGTYIAVRAFVVCKDASGNVLAPVYAPVVTTNY